MRAPAWTLCLLLACLSGGFAPHGARAAQPGRTGAQAPPAGPARLARSAELIRRLKPGEWYEVPNSKLRAVLPAPRPPDDYGSYRGIMAYSGGAFDTKRNRLIVWGGGHGDYSGNEVYVFDLDGLFWQRLTDPSLPTPPKAPSAYVNADGTPVSVHSYDGLEYLPALDKLWATGGSRWSDGKATPLTWTFDFTTLSWARKADIIPLGKWTELEAASAYDPVTGHVFMSSPSLSLHEYDPQADHWIQRGHRNESVGSGMVAAIDPVRRKFVAIGRGRVQAYDLAPSGVLMRQVLPTRGETAFLDTRYPGGFEYDPVGQQLVAWNGGAEVYTLNLDTLVWTKHPPAPTNTAIPSAERTGTFGRFRYVPSKNVFVLVNSIDQNIYFYRLSPAPGTAASAQPRVASTIPPTAPPTPRREPPVAIGMPATAPDGGRALRKPLTQDGKASGAYTAGAADERTRTATKGSDVPPALRAAAAGTPLDAAHPAPPPPPSGVQIDIPVKRWVALPLSRPWKRGVKHMTGALNPDNGRLYFVGGDHGGDPSNTVHYGSSYRQEVFSLSLAERFADKKNPAAGWRVEYPYCGPPGQVQPKNPDFVGWTWDPKRRLFWMVPGTMVAGGRGGCPGETSGRTNDPEFVIDHIMTFDPVARKWAQVRHVPYKHAVEQWMSVYDPKTDTLIRPGGDRIEIYDVTRDSWSYVPLGTGPRGRDIRIYNSALGADLRGRAIYAIDKDSGRLYRYRMDAKRLEDLGAIPGGPMQYELSFAQPFLVWDSVNEVVLWHRYPDGFFAYRPATGTWETLSTATDVPGTIAVGRVMVFDAHQNAVVLFGIDRIGDLTPPPLQTLMEASAPYMFLYRYGPGTANSRTEAAGRPQEARARAAAGPFATAQEPTGDQPLPHRTATALKAPTHASEVSVLQASALSGAAIGATGKSVPLAATGDTTQPAVATKQTVVSPSDPWCRIINGASPGEEILLAPGPYTATCRITARGEAATPITIRSQSQRPGQEASFVYSGSSANVLELRDALHLILRDLSFGPTQADVDAIRVRQAHDVVIERNTFRGIGGISIAANDKSTQRITVRGNTFRDLKATGIYFGCQDGRSCQALDFRIEGNLIDGVTTPFEPSAIGYGIEVKLNSYGLVRDNTIYRTKGPGIMVYGSDRGDAGNVIEGNYVEGSANEGGIVIGGGPALVRNNVLVHNAYGGISAQNYKGRNLQQSIRIVHNTLLNNAHSGINVAAWSPGAGNIIAYNAILPSPGTPALQPASPGGTITGNILCPIPAACFVNGTSAPYDLWPASGGPLQDAAGRGPEPWRPMDDFMGAPRGDAADVGAYERSSGTFDHLVGGGRVRPRRVSSPGGVPAKAAPTRVAADDGSRQVPDRGRMGLGATQGAWSRRAKAARACEARRDRASRGSGLLEPAAGARGLEQHPCLVQVAPRWWDP